jgi:hypothetical protein
METSSTTVCFSFTRVADLNRLMRPWTTVFVPMLSNYQLTARLNTTAAVMMCRFWEQACLVGL